ncbi:hypothetical protein EVAR_53128_1 [Eumeta japonica]|uniref:Uncharacterized protein n=1 Tax=Eumeta variegata TaxID=151549 RepID=A0A4C1YB03_EUMVA|nr:hypothetical protein EVAR_53128_1 [Eumeta japonica]
MTVLAAQYAGPFLRVRPRSPARMFSLWSWTWARRKWIAGYWDVFAHRADDTPVAYRRVYMDTWLYEFAYRFNSRLQRRLRSRGAAARLASLSINCTISYVP